MKKFLGLSLFPLALMAVLAVPSQAQIGGTYTVSGTVGSWFLDFVFANQYAVGSGVQIEGFGDASENSGNMLVTLGTTTSGFAARGRTPGVGWGANVRDACNLPGMEGWGDIFCSRVSAVGVGIRPGESAGGFQATFASTYAPNAIDFSYALYGSGWDPVGNGNLVSGNFTAVRTVVGVPEPGTYILMLTGMFGLGFMAWRRKEELLA